MRARPASLSARSLLTTALALAGCGLFEKDELAAPTSARPRAQVTGHNVGPAMPTAQAAGLAPAIHVEGTDLKDEAGNVVNLIGVNWFGFNVDEQAGPLGLWNPGIGGDFAHTVHRQRLLGFNAWRLPFSFAVFDKPAKSYKAACPDVSLEDLAKETLDPEVKDADLKLAFPLASPQARAPGECNGYLPESTIRDRYIWAVQFVLAQGGYVLLDNHLREDDTAKNDPARWAASWAALVKQVLAMPGAEGRVLVDLLNEPGQKGITWDSGTPGGLSALYLSAMDAISQVSDKVIFLIEGTGQDGLNANWGDGFCVDEGLIKAHGLSDPRPFFAALAAKPYAQRVVLGPHVYGPSVTHAPADFCGPGLKLRLAASFGQQMVSGVEAGGKKLTFPVAIGEFGSFFKDRGDLDFLKDFADYLSHGDEHHKPIGNFFYWCWNADSGDTGGLVQGDYKGIEWEKIRYLEGLGLKPWYRNTKAAAATTGPLTSSSAHTAPSPSQVPSPSAPTDKPSEPSASPTPADAPPAPSATLADKGTTSGSAAEQAGPSASGPPPSTPAAIDKLRDQSAPSQPDKAKLPPTIRPKDPTPVVTTALSSDGCECEVDMSGQWTEGDVQFASLNLYLRNGGGSAIKTPYDFKVSNPGYIQVGMSWNLAEPQCKEGDIHTKVEQGWQSLLPNGGNIVPVGFLVSSKEHDLMPKTVTINGRKCVITVCKR